MALSKATKSIMEEISENLKNTMMKYNEMEMDKDLSVVHSIDGEERHFDNIVISKDSISQMNKEYLASSSNDKRNKTGGSVNYTPMKLSNISKHENSSSRVTRDYFGSNKDDSRSQLSFDQKASRLLNGLSDFEQLINKDFDIIESMIEGSLNNVY